MIWILTWKTFNFKKDNNFFIQNTLLQNIKLNKNISVIIILGFINKIAF